jgi:outer membrane murein-binding lipoprotein Lpp
MSMKSFYLCFLAVLFLSACTSTPPLKEAIGDCKDDLKTLNAYGDTLQLEYDMNFKGKAEEAAKAWCEDRNKFATKNTHRCDNGCCVTTYRCKK